MDAELDPPLLRPLMIKHILLACAEHFDTDYFSIIGPQRCARLAHIRCVAMLLARQHTDSSLTKLGRIFRRDHTTVMNSLNNARDNAGIAADAEKILELANDMRKWTDDEVARVLALRAQKIPFKEIAVELDRNPDAIRCKLDHVTGKKDERKERAKAAALSKPLTLPPGFKPRVVDMLPDGTPLIEFYPGNVTAEPNLHYFGVRR